MTFSISKFLVAGVFAVAGTSVGVAQAANTVERSNLRSYGATLGFDSFTQCGENEYGSPLYVSFGLFLNTQTVRINSNTSQPNTQTTNLSMGYFNGCTGVSGAVFGQTDYNPENLVSIDNSQVASSLHSAQISATIPVQLQVYDSSGTTCWIKAHVMSTLQSIGTPTNSTDTLVEQGPGYHFQYHSNGKRVDAGGNFTVQLEMTPGCNLPGLPASISATAQQAIIVNSHNAMLQVTRQTP